MIEFAKLKSICIFNNRINVNRNERFLLKSIFFQILKLYTPVHMDGVFCAPRWLDKLSICIFLTRPYQRE